MKIQLKCKARLCTKTTEHNHITKCSVLLHKNEGVVNITHGGQIIITVVLYMCVCSTIQTCQIPESQMYRAAITVSEQVFSCCGGNKCNHRHFCPPMRYHFSSLPHRSASLVRDLNLILVCASLLLLSH